MMIEIIVGVCWNEALSFVAESKECASHVLTSNKTLKSGEA